MSLITRDYYTADEFATLKGAHVKSVYRWVKNGNAPEHEMLGRMLWFAKKAADAWQKPARGRKKKA